MRISYDVFPTLNIEGRNACNLITAGLMDMEAQGGPLDAETMASIRAKNPGIEDGSLPTEKLAVNQGPELELVCEGLIRQIDKRTKETGLVSEIHAWHAVLVRGKIVRQTNVFRAPSPYK